MISDIRNEEIEDLEEKLTRDSNVSRKAKTEWEEIKKRRKEKLDMAKRNFRDHVQEEVKHE